MFKHKSIYMFLRFSGKIIFLRFTNPPYVSDLFWTNLEFVNILFAIVNENFISYIYIYMCVCVCVCVRVSDKAYHQWNLAAGQHQSYRTSEKKTVTLTHHAYIQGRWYLSLAE